MHSLDFVSKITSTGCGGIKIAIPTNVLEVISATSPDIVYLNSAMLKGMDGKMIALKSPRLSKSNNNHRYFPIPKETASQYDVRIGQIYQVNVQW